MSEPTQNTLFLTRTYEILDLGKLKTPIHRLTSAMGEMLHDASVMCLDNQKHSGGVVFTVEKRISGTFNHTYTIKDWGIVNETIKDTYNDLKEAVEWGACGIAFLLIFELTKYKVVRRSAKGTGIDYWLEEKFNEDSLPFTKQSARLEVSGTLHNTDTNIDHIVRTKLAQTHPTDPLGIPAYIVVVEFNQPTARLVLKVINEPGN